LCSIICVIKCMSAVGCIWWVCGVP